MTFLFLVPNLLFFSKDLKKNFECQVGNGDQKNLFSGGAGGIKFELWGGGVSSFSGGVGGIKFEFWCRVLIFN